MDALKKKISIETVQLSKELRFYSEELVGALELLIFAESIECEEAVVNCLRYISLKFGFESTTLFDEKRDCLKNLLVKLNVSLPSRLKLMGLIQRRQLKERQYDSKSITNELIKQNNLNFENKRIRLTSEN